MDISRAVELLRRRPGMLGLDGSFGQAAAFLEGINAGQGGSWLAGFREWLIVRAETGANLTWRGLALRIAFPDDSPASPSAPLQSEDDKRAVEVLLEELEAFLEAKNDPGGLVRIYDSYLKWLKRQEWYGPESPSYLD